MTPPNPTKPPIRPNDNKTTTKTETVEKAPRIEVPVTPPTPATKETSEPAATATPKKAYDPNEKRAFTIMIPQRSYKLLGLIAKVEDKSISEVILDAIERAGLKDRAKTALAVLSADLGE